MSKEHIEDTEDNQPEDPQKEEVALAQTSAEVTGLIASQLGETDPGVLQLIRRVVKFVGISHAISYLQQTLEIEERGGLMTLDGSRRRTAGGVFFFVVKTNVPQTIRFALFPGNPGTHPYQPQRKTKQKQEESTQEATEVPDAWSDRLIALQDIGDQRGTASIVKIEVRGRPGKIIQRNTYLIISMDMTKIPSLPKGLPVPECERTTYTIYIANKQWKKVEEAIKDEGDMLILEGFPSLDSQTETIAVFVTNATTRQLQMAQRQTSKRGSIEGAQG
jgi:PHAX RNA-binding domain